MFRVILSLITIVRALFYISYLSLFGTKASIASASAHAKKNDDDENGSKRKLTICIIADNADSSCANTLLLDLLASSDGKSNNSDRFDITVLQTGPAARDAAINSGDHHLVLSRDGRRAVLDFFENNELRLQKQPGVSVACAAGSDTRASVVFKHGNDEQTDKINRQWEGQMAQWGRCVEAVRRINHLCATAAFFLLEALPLFIASRGSMSAVFNELRARSGASAALTATWLNPLHTMCDLRCLATTFFVSCEFFDKVIAPSYAAAAPHLHGDRLTTASQIAAAPAAIAPLLEDNALTFASPVQRAAAVFHVVEKRSATSSKNNNNITVVCDAVVEHVVPAGFQAASRDNNNAHTVKYIQGPSPTATELRCDCVIFAGVDPAVSTMLLHSFAGGKHRPGALGYLFESLVYADRRGSCFPVLRAKLCEQWMPSVSRGVFFCGAAHDPQFVAGGKFVAALKAEADTASALKVSAALKRRRAIA